jgi:putative PIN family toxin of toxin-antitoxin system
MNIRVVLDTNIIISAMLTPRRACAGLSDMPSRARFPALRQRTIFAEYEDVIRRPRFRRSAIEIESLLNTIRERSLWINPASVVRACSDPADNIFLECAQAAGAIYLVTGNAKHFPTSWEGTDIVTARQLLDSVL